jgi:hypothetical protein
MHSAADVIIVGAGAAGLATGIFLGRHRPGTRIVALDGARRVGAKILVSGGGRCNVTNVRVTAADFYGGNRNLLRRILAAFPETAARTFFEEIGVPLHEEEHGKLFPNDNSAKSVLNALLAEARRCGVNVLAGHRVTGVSRADDVFRVDVQAAGGNAAYAAPQVVLATGGLSLPKTGSDGAGYTFAQALGHRIEPTTPALDPLTLSGSLHRDLSGVSHQAQLTFHAKDARPVRIAGPILWTHFGLSGPAALNISRFWNRTRALGGDRRVTVNFAAGADFAAVDHALLELTATQPRAKVLSAIRQWLPARLAQAFCEHLRVPQDVECAHLSREARRAIVHLLVEWPLPVNGTRGYGFAEVTAGGVPLGDVDPSTMGSRVCPGLTLVGEILDVDGPIGGYNFQWAWSSAFVAGTALGRAIR